MAAQTTPASAKGGAVDDDDDGGGATCAGRVASALQKALASMTVEPAFALYCVAETMSKFLHQAFLLEKHAYADWAHEPPRWAAAGRDADADGAKEAAVRFVAFANSWLITPAVFCSVVYTVMAISWSDRAGKRRRPLILTPLLGLALECAGAALHAYFWRWPVGWLLATYALAQLAFGGRICFSQCAYLYVADVTSDADRTARYGVLMTVRFFAMPLGYACGGLLLAYVGFFYAFVAAFALALAALLSAAVLVADPVASAPAHPRRPLTFWQAVQPMDSVRSVRVLLKKRPQHTRLILLATLLAYTLFSFTNEGELSVMYLYLSRQFRWNESQIGVYLTYRMFINGVGTLVCSVILSKWLKMEDGSIGIFIGVARCGAALAYALANVDWQLYAVPLVDMYFAAGITVTRSFATKLVTTDELGRLAAVCSLTKVSVALCQPLYNTTYALTMNSAPSAFFCVSLFFAVLILLLIGVSRKLYRKQRIKTSDHVLLS